MNFEQILAGLTLVPRNITVRAIVLAGLVAPWVWLVVLDRRLHRSR